jgi:ribosomal protein L40E
METVICPNCGAMNPCHYAYCGMCGSAMIQPVQQPKPRTSELHYGIIALLIGVSTIIAFNAVFFLTISPPLNNHDTQAVFGIVKGTTADTLTWTITAISGGASVLRSDVYVQLRNASGDYVIATEPMTVASGTHGFNYAAASAGNYISVGDVITLSDDYAVGSVIYLVTAGAVGQYAVLSVT